MENDDHRDSVTQRSRSGELAVVFGVLPSTSRTTASEVPRCEAMQKAELAGHHGNGVASPATATVSLAERHLVARSAIIRNMRNRAASSVLVLTRRVSSINV